MCFQNFVDVVQRTKTKITGVYWSLALQNTPPHCQQKPLCFMSGATCPVLGCDAPPCFLPHPFVAVPTVPLPRWEVVLSRSYFGETAAEIGRVRPGGPRC